MLYVLPGAAIANEPLGSINDEGEDEMVEAGDRVETSVDTHTPHTTLPSAMPTSSCANVRLATATDSTGAIEVGSSCVFPSVGVTPDPVHSSVVSMENAPAPTISMGLVDDTGCYNIASSNSTEVYLCTKYKSHCFGV